MRTRRLIALAPIALLSACVAEEPLALPNLAGHRTVVVRVTAGGSVAAYAAAVRDPLSIPLGLDRARGAERLVVAFDATLEELMLDEGPIEVADDVACGRHLGAPAGVWTAKVEDGRPTGWAEGTSGSLLGLRVAPKRGSCPKLAGERAMWPQLQCARNDCHASVTQTECAIVIDTGQCGYGERLHGEIGVKGELCFEPSPALGTCDPVSPSAPLLASFECSGASGPACTVNVIGDVATRPLVTTKNALWAANAWRDPDLSRVGEAYLRDLLVVGDELLVVGATVAHSAWGCGKDQLYVVSLETLQVVDTAPLPPCLDRLREDPLGDGFVAVWGGTSPKIGRLDARGHVLAEVAYGGPGPDPELAPIGLALTAGPHPAAVVVLSDNVNEGHATQFFSVNLQTMTELQAPSAMESVVTGVEPYDDHQVMIVNATRRTISLFDPRTRAYVTGPTTLGTATGIDMGIAQYNAALDMVLLTTDEQSGGVFAFLPTFERKNHVWPYERFANVWGLGPWPADPSLALVSMVSSGGGYEASIALFDPRVPRFLPSAETVGVGPIYRMVADDHGRVFALLAWLPEVVRIEARG